MLTDIQIHIDSETERKNLEVSEARLSGRYKSQVCEKGDKAWMPWPVPIPRYKSLKCKLMSGPRLRAPARLT